jgi:hypothetical protein
VANIKVFPLAILVETAASERDVTTGLRANVLDNPAQLYGFFLRPNVVSHCHILGGLWSSTAQAPAPVNRERTVPSDRRWKRLNFIEFHRGETAHNGLVGGSSPSRPTIFKMLIHRHIPIFLQISKEPFIYF